MNKNWYKSALTYYTMNIKDNPDLVASINIDSAINAVKNHGFQGDKIKFLSTPFHYVKASFYMAAVNEKIISISDYFLTCDLLYFSSPEAFIETVCNDMRVFTMTLVSEGFLEESDHESAAYVALDILKNACNDDNQMQNLTNSFRKELSKLNK